MNTGKRNQEKRGKHTDPLSVLFSRCFSICRDSESCWGWDLSRSCQSFGVTAESPKQGRLHIGSDAQEVQGKIRYWSSRDCGAYLSLQNIRKSLHISSAATTDLQSLWTLSSSLRNMNITTQHHVTLLKSSQVISISLTTGVQVSALNLLLKHF